MLLIARISLKYSAYCYVICTILLSVCIDFFFYTGLSIAAYVFTKGKDNLHTPLGKHLFLCNEKFAKALVSIVKVLSVSFLQTARVLC